MIDDMSYKLECAVWLTPEVDEINLEQRLAH